MAKTKEDGAFLLVLLYGPPSRFGNALISSF